MEKSPLWKRNFPFAECSQETFKEAFCHSSYVHENSSARSNERAEFLGDAVVDLLVSRDLFQQYPSSSEGELSQWRSSIVSEAGLSKLCRTLELQVFLLLGRGESISHGDQKSSVQANLVEAILGVTYDRFGMMLCEKIWSHWLELFAELYGADFYKEQIKKQVDLKSRLQEWLMAKKMALPRYTISPMVGAEGFVGQVYCASQSFGPVEGTSKKKIEKALAAEAYRSLTHGNSL